MSTYGRFEIGTSLIPDGWYLETLSDVRTPHKFAKHVATHIAWICQLQHVNGGRLTSATGKEPQVAINEAIRIIKEQQR